MLEVKDLTVDFTVEEGLAQVVRGVSFSIPEGKTVGLVGESGSGKSVSSLALMGLLESPPAVISGNALLMQKEIMGIPEVEKRAMRGKDMAMIFQEPMTSLNPVYTIGDQVSEALRAHSVVSYQESWSKAVEALSAVGIPGAEEVASRYPHELSGGMKQRAMIAMAIITRPKLLIADEPTTALDVTVQAQILELLKELQNTYKMSMLFITHDLGVIAELAHEVCVMYCGKIVERAEVTELFAHPLHPYTQALLRSIPKIHGEKERLYSIPGVVPSPQELPVGCKFAPRCEKATEKCKEIEPELLPITEGRLCACYNA